MDRPLETSVQNNLQIIDCGVADYRKVLRQQVELHVQRVAGQISDTVLICEHHAVITLGARKAANKLLADPTQLSRQGIEVVEVTRGGGTTAHNPGQLVFYPILNLKRWGLSAGQYIRTLEEIGIGLLEGLGVEAQRRNGLPGLWVVDRKIASIGVRIQKGVTFHGMAINIQNDLALFDLFVPCGLDGVQMTSVFIETGRPCPMTQAKENLSALLLRHFP
jgi:lipoate-protein ligase B